MILEGDLGKQFIEAVKEHTDHRIYVTCYCDSSNHPINYSVECMTCNEVIIDANVED